MHTALLAPIDFQSAFEATVASEAFFAATVVTGALWLAASCFLSWRQRAAGLTPVGTALGEAPSPDFMRVDHKARAQAMERGDAHRARLDARDAAEAAAVPGPAIAAERAGGVLALLMSTFTLASMVFGAVMQVRWMGHYAEDLTAPGRIVELVRAHPAAFAIAVLVAILQIARFARAKKRA